MGVRATATRWARASTSTWADRRLSGEVQSGHELRVAERPARCTSAWTAPRATSRIEVQWPGGGRESFPGGEGNRMVVLEQGKGIPVAGR